MNSWVRLWHDMPTDPKFRTIARAAKQPLTTVVAVFTFLLTDASANENERGRTTATDEDIASAFDIDESDVAAIKKAMQGRVLDGDMLAGWAKRQPKKEDNSAERARAWRAQKQAEAEAERSRTIANAEERPDAEADTDKNQNRNNPPIAPQGGGAGDLFEDLVSIFPVCPNTKRDRAFKAFSRRPDTEQRDIIAAARKYADWSEAERIRRGRSKDEAAAFVPPLDGWIVNGTWKSVAGLSDAPAVEPMVKLDRVRDEALWLACEAVMGKKAPTSDSTWSFRQSVVDQARASIHDMGGERAAS